MSDKQRVIEDLLEAYAADSSLEFMREAAELLQATQQEAEPVGIRSSKLIDKEKMFSVIEEYRDYHHPPTSEWDFNSGFRHAIKIVVGMAMEGRFAAPQPAKPAVPDESDLWKVLEAAVEAIDRKAAPHAFVSLAWEAGSAVIVKRRAALLAAPQPGEGDNKK